jgi:hypothetical protein
VDFGLADMVEPGLPKSRLIQNLKIIGFLVLPLFFIPSQIETSGFIFPFNNQMMYPLRRQAHQANKHHNERLMA